MTPISAILAWRTENLGTAARRWASLARLMESAAGDIDGRIDGVGADELSGDIRGSAETAVHDAGGRVRRDGALVSRFAEELGEAAISLTSARDDLRVAVGEARAAGLTVDDDTGEVMRPLRFGAIDIDAANPDSDRRLSEAVRSALRRVRSLDDELAAALPALHPPRRHMYVPGVRFGAGEAASGLPGARADAAQGIYDAFGLGDDAEVTVLDRTATTTTIIAGDPAGADRIVTIVPGTGSSPEDLLAQTDKAGATMGTGRPSP
ncbi:hypothetical protein WU86_01520 [Corynebacterium xerosis]|nr:hypothetical protein [Corynebacterium xerosis]KKO82670.1 hypothetical protein WU86_01520 [Corynebacterium xerosis]